MKLHRKLVVIALTILVIVVVGARITINKFGDARPVFLPASGNLPEIVDNQQSRQLESSPLPQIEPVNFPLKIPSGYQISVFARNLGKPRDLAISRGGILLVSIPSSGRVLALPDKNNDGRAEVIEVLKNLNNPHGIAFNSGYLFVAEETRISRYNWDETSLTAKLDKKLFDLPKGGRHTTRTIAFNKLGQMFVSIGSTCDVCIEKNPWNAAIIISDKEGNSPRVYAKGLRNAVFIAVSPVTDELWGVEMGRDFLGDNLPPDEINILSDAADYGWPICYGNKIHDTSFDKNVYVRDPCSDTVAPIFEIPAHSAPLGLAFWRGDLLISYHGSWNRSSPTGYKIVKMKLDGNKIIGVEDFITGFLSGSQALGRPVDIEVGRHGELYVSDDKSGAVYFVTS